VLLAGGATVVQQYLAAGLVDEFELHIVPVLLGAGARHPTLDTVTMSGNAIADARA
jgi:dihydrofolate reductase